MSPRFGSGPGAIHRAVVVGFRTEEAQAEESEIPPFTVAATKADSLPKSATWKR
jgi:hypothetical protein